MPDFAKKIRVRKRNELKNHKTRTRIELSIEWQEEKLRRQSAFLANFQNEIERHLFGVDHKYEEDFRDLIYKQLEQISNARAELSSALENLKLMKKKAIAGEF